MALEAWYPLHKDFNDYSGNENHLEGTATMVPDGKIGSAPTGNVGCSLKIPLNENIKRVFSGDDFTITFWVRNGSGNDDWSDILQYYDNYNIVRRFERFNSSQPTMSDFWVNIGRNENPYVSSIHSSANNGIPIDTWYHVAIVHTTTTSSIYFNGQLHGTSTPDDPTMSGIATDLKILNGSGNPDSELNDLRFYSHALSLYEVQKIAMCKILHWNFNEMMDVSPVPGRYADNEMALLQDWRMTGLGAVSPTASPLGSGDVYTLDWVVKFGRDYSTANGFEYPFPNTLLPSSTYCFSVWLKLADGETNPPSGFEFGIGTEDATSYHEIDASGTILNTYATEADMGAAVTTSWKRFCCITTISWYVMDSYVRAGFRLYATQYEYCHPQLTETDVPVAYSEPAELLSIDTFYDCSGFRNHGVPNDTDGLLIGGQGSEAGTFDRYISNVDGHKTYIQSDDTVYIPKEGTMMAWIWGSPYDQRPDNLYPFGFDLFCSVANLSSGAARNGLYYQTDGSATATANEITPAVDLYDQNWHHYAVSWDSTTLTTNVWVDGVFIGSSTNTSPMYHVGTWRRALMGVRTTSSPYGAHTGMFSDFRIYGTVLDDNQIEKIYHAKANITRDSKLSLYEVNAISHRGGSNRLLTVKGSGWENGADDFRVTNMGGTQHASSIRGHCVVVFDRQFNYWGSAAADTYAGTGTSDYYAYAPYNYSTPSTTFPAAGSSAAACDRLRDYIETIPDGYLVCITTRDSALMSESWYHQLQKYFGVSTNMADLDSTRINWLVVAEKKGKLYAEKFAARYDGYVEASIYLTHNKGINGRGVLDVLDVSEVGVTDGLIGYWKLDQQTSDYASNLQNVTEANVSFEENALKLEPGTYIQTGLDGFSDMANSTGFTLMAMIKRKYDTSDLTDYPRGVLFGGFGYNWGIVAYNPESDSYQGSVWRDLSGDGVIGSGDAGTVTPPVSGQGSLYWDFVCLRYDPITRDLTLVVNDSEDILTVPNTGDLVLNGDRLDIGSDSGSDVWATRALIKEARCFNRALTNEEVVLMRKYLLNETGMNISRDYTAYVKEVSEI